MRPSNLLTVALVALPAAGAAPAPQMSVFGHKVPDTDAICGALVYAWELNERGMKAQAYRLGSLNRETEYVLKALKLEQPPMLEDVADGEVVAVVDTNNPDELPANLKKANLHSIIDHHKLSGLTTSAPLEMDVRALCSTGSILYARAKASGRTVPPTIAGLMLSCILSDSLHFRSPTTTDLDREFAAELAEIAGIDIQAHADAMLDAKAEIDHLSPTDVVMMDSKVYEIGGRRLRISVVETTRPDTALKQRQALKDAQRTIASDEKLDDVLLFIVDILNESATFLSSGATAGRLVEQAWEGCALNPADGTCVLPGVLSRKKQIIPTLEAGAARESEIATISPTANVAPAPAAAGQRLAAAA